MDEASHHSGNRFLGDPLRRLLCRIRYVSPRYFLDYTYQYAYQHSYRDKEKAQKKEAHKETFSCVQKIIRNFPIGKATRKTEKLKGPQSFTDLCGPFFIHILKAISY